MKNFYFIIILSVLYTTKIYAQSDQRIVGKIVSKEEGSYIDNASIVIKGTNIGTVSNATGVFTLPIPHDKTTLVISKLGYLTQSVLYTYQPDTLIIALEKNINAIEEVIVSTGYQRIPKERATGSFTHIDNALINRSASTDIISRLEGVTSALQFDRRRVNNTTNDGDYKDLRIRGVSTINSDMSPLVVVDNFPYDGDINNINPNDVENITILKDAAAASIWGARAGNGVIVITTKKGQYQQPTKITITGNLSFREKPDLFYDPGFLNAKDFISVEKELFGRNYYNSQITNANQAPISPVVELLDQYRKGLITNEVLNERLNQLETFDVREDASKYLYRDVINQQYALNFSGGAEKFSYLVSGGIDKNINEKIGNDFSRITLNSLNTYKVNSNIGLTIGVNYTANKANNNGFDMGAISITGRSNLYPYARFADANGVSLAIPSKHRLSYVDNLINNEELSWAYKPIEEIHLGNNVNESQEFRVNTGLHYAILKNLNVDLKYQYQNTRGNNRNVRNRDSYFVRDLVNRFTQADGTQVFPWAAILQQSNNIQLSHFGRAQLNFSEKYKDRHELSALAGIELRQAHFQNSGFTLYGYNDEVLTYSSSLNYDVMYNIRPRGTERIPGPGFPMADFLDRFLSYFGNASYSYDNRYVVSGSVRWDASNLFGVSTNQKGVPLWSSGILWHLSNESFYDIKWLPQLNFRLTYGYNGNVNRNLAAVPSFSYRTDMITGYLTGFVRSPDNPNLRWEKNRVINLGVDFSSVNQLIYGSIEYYSKHSADLLGRPLLDPTVGIKLNDPWIRPMFNYADMLTNGLDIEIASNIIDRKFKWQTALLLNHVSNKVTNYEPVGSGVGITAYTHNFNSPPVIGKSLDAVFSFPWAGLDPQTGDPLVNIDGEQSKNYSAYINSLSQNDLVYSGVSVPRWFGAIRNSVGYKNIHLSFNISFKADYVFRRTTIGYTGLFNSWTGHKDFLSRWQNPGDEQFTSIPSMPAGNVANRDLVYVGSTELIENGNHIRFQDLSLSYMFANTQRINISSARLFLYANNLGIIWRANKKGLDPDYPSASLLPGKSITLGLNISL